MSTAKTALTTIRCPFCMNGETTDHDRESKERITCKQCERSFRVRDALDDYYEGKAQTVSPEPSLDGSWSASGQLIYAVVWAVGLVLFSFLALEMYGAWWFVAYCCLCAAMLVAKGVLKGKVTDSHFASLLYTIGFLGVGGFRYWYGSTYLDMHKWEMLVFAAVTGTLCIWLRSDVSRGGLSGGSSSSGDCSSCGGGGCGGGCGGCS